MQRPSTFSRQCTNTFVVDADINNEPEFCVRDSSPEPQWDDREEDRLQSPQSRSSFVRRSSRSSANYYFPRKSRSGPSSKGQSSTLYQGAWPSENDLQDPFRIISPKSKLIRGKSASMRETRGISMDEYIQGRQTNKKEGHRKSKSLEEFVSLHSDRAVIQPHHLNARQTKSLEELFQRRDKVTQSPRRGSRRTRSTDMEAKASPTNQQQQHPPVSATNTPIARRKSVQEEFCELYMPQSPLLTPRSESSPRRVLLKKSNSRRKNSDIPFLDNAWFLDDAANKQRNLEGETPTPTLSPSKTYKVRLVPANHRPRSSSSRGRSIRLGHSSNRSGQRTADRSMTPNGRRGAEDPLEVPRPLLSNYLDGKSDTEPDDLLPGREATSTVESQPGSLWKEVAFLMDTNRHRVAMDAFDKCPTTPNDRRSRRPEQSPRSSTRLRTRNRSHSRSSERMNL